jgi:hypothetical protein
VFGVCEIDNVNSHYVLFLKIQSAICQEKQSFSGNENYRISRNFSLFLYMFGKIFSRKTKINFAKVSQIYENERFCFNPSGHI